jgi:hypothetical protein
MIVLPPDMVNNGIQIMKLVSSENGLNIPDGFWTAKSAADSNYFRDLSPEQLALFPDFQFVIEGEDGAMVLWELKPITYFKEFPGQGRVFAFRRSSGFNILGQVAMENVHVLFDLRNETIAIGSNASKCGATP